ncbi:sulfite exporter TauE/SafE family protein [Bacillus sp. FJAT-45037]|uniref:sulfite exporter TauE/SafE family protein n=1 Tax=Bacillus sp. FJAT-45037 TaxID=2011007 RepID=UPI0018E20BAF|nr:sulfite exporter TauE/SafE family protein [Bacillus sp. FJAT-45037]
MIWEFVFIFIVVLIGGFVQGVSGFGLGLVVMGFLPLILSLKDSTLLVMSLLLVASLSIAVKTYKHIERRGLFFILVFAIVGRIGAFFVLSTFGDMDFLKQWLAFFLIGMVIYLFLSGKKRDINSDIHPIIPILLGFFGGFIGGVFAVGGPFFVFYFLLLYADKHKYNANMQMTVVVTSSFSLLLHGVNGDFDSSFLTYFLVGVVATWVGTWLGMKWFERVPSHLIRKFAMILVLGAAINLLIFG